jgi:hypothetical protein
MRLMALLATLALLAAGYRFPAQAGKTTPDLFAGSQQMIVVVTPDWDAIDGKLQLYERPTAAKAWQPVGASIPVVVGKHGLGWGPRAGVAW